MYFRLVFMIIWKKGFNWFYIMFLFIDGERLFDIINFIRFLLKGKNNNECVFKFFIDLRVEVVEVI